MRKWGSFVGAGLVFALMKATDNNYQVPGVSIGVARSALGCGGGGDPNVVVGTNTPVLAGVWIVRS